MVERRDVVLARVFFIDSPESKIRPAVVLSDQEYQKSGYVLLAIITTANDENCIPISDKDINCELDRDSTVRCDSVVRIHSRQLIKTIGKTKTEFYEKFIAKLNILIS